MLIGTVRDLRAVLRWIDGRLRLQWLALIPIMTVAAVLEAIGAVAVFGLLRLVVEPHRVRITPGVSQIWLAWPTDDPPAIVALLIGLVALFYVLRAAYLVWAEWFKESIVARSAARAADRLFARYLAADYLFHLQRRSSSLIQEIARSTDVAYRLVAASVVNIMAETITIAALIAVLTVAAPGRTLLAVAVVLIVVAVPFVMTRRLWVRWGERHHALEEQQLRLLQQSLGAITELKVSGREAFFESKLRALRRDLAKVEATQSALAAGQRLGVETALIVALLGVVWMVTRTGASGADTLSLMALFAYTGFRVVPSANRIMLNAGFFRSGRAFVQGAISDFEALERVSTRPQGHEPRVQFSDALVCEDVSFTYEEGLAPAVKNVYMRLAPGDSLGIVGATGSGKSTLVALLLGLLTPTSGRILLDGVPLDGLERAWQRLVGYVPQDPYLLDDSLRRNVALGVPDASIDEQRVARACTLAQLDDFIRQLPQGLDTNVGEEGVRLSGGQRQRVAIARALYHDPAVLVFDEATAALDNHTEREVTRAIASLHDTRTLIVIAHRLSTVESCDRLIFLQDGRIAATGRFDELMENAAFRGLAAR
jgi:ABC-type multidrug transport system fused ATPase/permease subunit